MGAATATDRQVRTANLSSFSLSFFFIRFESGENLTKEKDKEERDRFMRAGKGESSRAH